MPDVLKPSLALLSKLGSIVVHADEIISPGSHSFDVAAIRTLLEDAEVRQWIRDMGVYMPVKRSAGART